MAGSALTIVQLTYGTYAFINGKRERKMKGVARAPLLAALWLSMGLGMQARAQGVTDQAVYFGQTAGITGPLAGSVKESNEGVKLYFDWINSRGGINGRKLMLDSRDDKFDAKIAAENARQLVAERSPIAFLLPRGTPITEAVIPVAKTAGIAVIAPGTGAEIFHTPVNPLVFNLRAKYQTEVEKAVEHLGAVGISRIAFVYINDSFGADVRVGFERKMADLKLKPVAMQSFERNGDTSAAESAVLKSDPQAVILAASAVHAAKVINRVRKEGNQMQFVALSNNATKSFVAGLGNNARGVMVVQSFPNPRGSSQIAREIRNLAKEHPEMVISQQTVEGFSAAKLVAEAVRRAGKTPTPQSLIAALETIRDFDVGGFLINYRPSDHTGATFVEISIIDRRGEFLQ